MDDRIRSGEHLDHNQPSTQSMLSGRSGGAETPRDVLIQRN